MRPVSKISTFLAFESMIKEISESYKTRDFKLSPE